MKHRESKSPYALKSDTSGRGTSGIQGSSSNLSNNLESKRPEIGMSAHHLEKYNKFLEKVVD